MTEWEVHTSDTQSILAEFALSDPGDLNTITRGETATYVFGDVLSTLTINEGDTYTIESGESVEFDYVVVNGTLTINGELTADEVDNNGTINLNGTLNIDEKFGFELAEIEVYSTYAGKFNVSETLASQQRYSENVPPSADIETLLVGIEPRGSLTDETLNGYWGLIENVTDSRNRALSNNEVELSITVLAPYEEYDDHTAVENDLKT